MSQVCTGCETENEPDRAYCIECWRMLPAGFHPSLVGGLTPKGWTQVSHELYVRWVHETTGSALRETMPCGCWYRLDDPGVYKIGGVCEEHRDTPGRLLPQPEHWLKRTA